MELPKNTKLYRGIDMKPVTLTHDTILKTNTYENVIWTTEDPIAAATYIPETEGYTYITIQKDKEFTPHNELAEILIKNAGGDFTVTEREHKLKTKHQIPKKYTINNTWGRPISWILHKKWTTQNIIHYIENLGYIKSEYNSYKIKTGYKNNKTTIFPENHKLKGTLIEFQTTKDIPIYDATQFHHDLLEPQYYKIKKFKNAAINLKKGAIKLKDFAQTELHGNVEHTSIAILPEAIKYLKITKILRCEHHEWDENWNCETLKKILT